MLIEFWRDEDGATAVEYAMLASLVAVAIVVAVVAVGDETRALYERVVEAVEDAWG